MTEPMETGIDGAVRFFDVSTGFDGDCNAAYDYLRKPLNLRPLADLITAPCLSQCMGQRVIFGVSGRRETITEDVTTEEGLSHYHHLDNGVSVMVSTYQARNSVTVMTWSRNNHTCYSFRLNFGRWEGRGLSQSETRGLLALIPTELLQRTWLFAWDSTNPLSLGGCKQWRAQEWLAAMDEGAGKDNQ